MTTEWYLFQNFTVVILRYNFTANLMESVIDYDLLFHSMDRKFHLVIIDFKPSNGLIKRTTLIGSVSW